MIAIDDVPERLAMAAAAGAITINFEQESVLERLNDMTDGHGPDKCIDAVGMEAHANVALEQSIDRVQPALMLETDRPHALRETIMAASRPERSPFPASTAGCRHDPDRRR